MGIHNRIRNAWLPRHAGPWSWDDSQHLGHVFPCRRYSAELTHVRPSQIVFKPSRGISKLFELITKHKKFFGG